MRSTDILIVDDEVGIRDLLSEILQDEGYTVTTAENANVARELREQVRPAMVLLDIWMPDCDGITLLKEWSKNGLLDMPVVVMSGHGSIDTAVEATKIGALNYLEKPITMQKLLETVRYAMKHSAIQASSVLSLNKLGKSEKIQELISELRDISKTENNILLCGEVGSPFEIIARFFQSDNAPWIIPNKSEDWLEYKLDWLKAARNGIVYLGDIAQYDQTVQKELLSVMQKRDQFNTRFIGYLCKPLESIYSDAEFDLQFIEEISNSVVTIPPLREQLSDLFFLINNILTQLVESKQVKMIRFNSAALNVLTQYDWPGNIEQLKHVVKNLALNADEGLVDADQVISLLEQFKTDYQGDFGGFNFDQPLRELREEVERSYFEYHIRQENNNMSRVAQRVGLERTHLYRKLKQLGVNFSKKK
ncbi:MAG: sigma-54 dependent transcriptional regulator [Neisseriaceae bacterium]|nr:sigma-54 dependent transcriptional regulator [Neisseriaceae bacterium]